jgi:hypothetical protein
VIQLNGKANFLHQLVHTKQSPFISKQTRLNIGSGTDPRIRSLVEEATQGRKTYLLRCYVDGKHFEHYSIHVIQHVAKRYKHLPKTTHQIKQPFHIARSALSRRLPHNSRSTLRTLTTQILCSPVHDYA